MDMNEYLRLINPSNGKILKPFFTGEYSLLEP